jgi:hypothetical protein
VLTTTVQTLAVKPATPSAAETAGMPAPTAEATPSPIFITNKKGQLGFDF